MVSIIDGNFSNGSTRVSVSKLGGATTLGYRTLGEGIFYYEILCENDSIHKRIGVSENINQEWVFNGQFNKAIYPIGGNISAGSIYGVILDLSGSIGKMSWNLNGGDFSDWIELRDYYGNVINFFRVAIVGNSSGEVDKYFKIIYDKNSFITDVEKIFEKTRSNVFYSFDGNYKVSSGILFLDGKGSVKSIGKFNHLIELPSHSEQNFINYGMVSPIQFNGFFTNKNYILQDGVSKNENGYWITKLDRKPLSIKFE